MPAAIVSTRLNERYQASRARCSRHGSATCTMRASSNGCSRADEGESRYSLRALRDRHAARHRWHGRSVSGHDRTLGRDVALNAGIDALNSPTVTTPASAPGIILGTASYMAPERARGRPVDKRAETLLLRRVRGRCGALRQRQRNERRIRAGAGREHEVLSSLVHERHRNGARFRWNRNGAHLLA